MSEQLPKIYGTCPAGCRWETVHRSEFEKSASHIKQYMQDDGLYHLEVGKEYKAIDVRANDEFNACLSVDLIYDGDVSFVKLFDGVKNPDPFSNTFTFKVLGLSDVDGIISIVYEFCGVRYSETVDIVEEITGVYLDWGGELYLYNADATIKAENGKSAYEIAVEHGFEGTEQEWLETFTHGADGKTPYIQDGYWYIDGVNTNVKAEGKDGKDAYQYAQDGGYSGTEEEFSAKLANGYKTNPLYSNKKILLMGDSITVGGTSDWRWAKWFKEFMSPAILVNTAVSSARWCDHSDTVYDGNPVFNGEDNNHNNTIGNQVEKIVRGKDSTHANYVEVPDYADFDMIIIAAGTNDSTPSGDIESSFVSNGIVVEKSALDKTVFSSAFRYSVETLRNLYPNATIFICTPIQTADAIRPYANMKTKRDYLISLCERMSVEVIDTFMCGICSIYEVSGAAGKYLKDGLHPNADGAKLMARYNTNAIARYYACDVEADSGADPEGYTNQVPISTDINGNIYNGVGFKNDAKISSNSPGSDVAAEGYVATGFIPFTEGDVLRSSGTAVLRNDTTVRLMGYDKDKNYLWYTNGANIYNYMKNWYDENGNLKFDSGSDNNAEYTPMEDVAFIRLCLYGTGDGLIVTKNEEITQ